MSDDDDAQRIDDMLATPAVINQMLHTTATPTVQPAADATAIKRIDTPFLLRVPLQQNHGGGDAFAIVWHVDDEQNGCPLADGGKKIAVITVVDPERHSLSKQQIYTSFSTVVAKLRRTKNINGWENSYAMTGGADGTWTRTSRLRVKKGGGGFLNSDTSRRINAMYDNKSFDAVLGEPVPRDIAAQLARCGVVIAAATAPTTGAKRETNGGNSNGGNKKQRRSSAGLETNKSRLQRLEERLANAEQRLAQYDAMFHTAAGTSTTTTTTLTEELTRVFGGGDSSADSSLSATPINSSIASPWESFEFLFTGGGVANHHD